MSYWVLKEVVLRNRQAKIAAATTLQQALVTDAPAVSFSGPEAVDNLFDWLEPTRPGQQEV